MKRFCSLLLLLFIGWNAQAQIDKIKFSSQLTKRHINLKGTRASIIMPEDWKKSEGITGVTDGGNINVLFVDAPQSFQKYQKISLKDLKQNFINNGSTVKQIIRLKNERFSPIVVELVNSSGVKLLQILLGDENFTLVIAGYYGNEQEKKEVLNFIASLYIDTNKKMDAKSVAKFTLDLSKTDLEAKGYNGVIFSYQTKNFMKRPKNERARIMIIQIPTSSLSDESLQEICGAQLQKDKKNQKVISRGAIQTKVGKGYRIIAKDKTYKNINYWLATGNRDTILFVRAISLKATEKAIENFNDLLLKNLKLK